MNVLIVNYPVLNIGGIEQNLYRYIKYCLEQNYRVIWIARTPVQIDESYKDILKNMEVIYAERNIFGRWKHDTISLKKDDTHVILSFTPFDMDNALKLIEENPNCKFIPIYNVANTKGRYYFIEEYYFGFIKKRIYKKIEKISREWFRSKWICFYTDLQENAFKAQYKLEDLDIEGLIVPAFYDIKPIDYAILDKRVERTEFNIITISRFDFPHKQYLLGLIDDFAKLKIRYPKIKLNIIGYGQN